MLPKGIIRHNRKGFTAREGFWMIVFRMELPVASRDCEKCMDVEQHLL